MKTLQSFPSRVRRAAPFTLLAIVLALFVAIETDAMVQTSAPGHFMIPAAPAVGTGVTGGAANTYTTNAVQMTASTSAALYITAVTVQLSSTSKPTYVEVRLSTGAADGTIVDEEVIPIAYNAGATGTQLMGRVEIYPPIPVANATRIGCKTADSVGALAWLVTLTCINQSNVVAATATNETANVIQWNTTNVASPATAGIPEVNVKNINNVAQTGRDIGASVLLAAAQKVDVDTIKTNPVVNGGTVTFPTNATLASTTNITAGTVATVTNQLTAAQIATGVWQDTTAGDFTTASSIGKSLYTSGVVPGGANGLFIAGSDAATTVNITGNLTGNVSGSVGSVTGAVGSVTGLTASNLDTTVSSRMATYTQPTGFLAATFPSGTIANTTNITAGTITTATNLTTNNDKTGYSLSVTPPTAATIASAVWQDTTAGDFTTGLSIGKSVLNGVSLGTGLTINAYTGNTPQTGDAYARIGAAGAGLTALGDTRVANLDAAVSSRMATYTQPTGFLAATFPSGTIANTTNITAGTITTATNLTTNNDKTGYSLSVTPPTAATIATTLWQDLTSGSDFTTSNSIGKLLVDDINATISSRSTYAGGDTSGTTTLLSRLTSGRATDLDNLDATVSSRSTYAGGDTSGTTTLLSRLTSTRAGLLDNLDAAISSRSTYAGGDTSGTTTLLTRIPSSLTITGGKVDVNDKTGFSLTGAYDPVDPLGVTLPGSYTGQQAGALLWKIGNRPNQ